MTIQVRDEQVKHSVDNGKLIVVEGPVWETDVLSASPRSKHFSCATFFRVMICEIFGFQKLKFVIN